MLFRSLATVALSLSSWASAATSAGDPKAGQTVFTTSCGACHTFKAAKTTGMVGPNLDKSKLSYAAIVSIVTKGKQGKAGVMPALKGTLSTKQIQDVAAFVSTKRS